jgi:WD40 repeat protein
VISIPDSPPQLWSLAEGLMLRTFEQAGTGHAWRMSFSPDGTSLAGAWLTSERASGGVRLWAVSDGSLQGNLEGLQKAASPIAFSPDGQLLVTGSLESGGALRLWRLSDRALMHTLPCPNSCTSVVFSPYGAVLASGSIYGEVQLWSVKDGTLLNTLRGHTETVSGLAFSPDGSLLASGSSDGTVRLWGIAN